MDQLCRSSSKASPPLSVYIHIPFCQQRCTYCDFNTVAGKAPLIPGYVEALCTEIVKTTANSPDKLPVHTIFYGGGTPTLLSASQLAIIQETISRSFLLLPGLECTIEGNPGTLTREKLAGYRTMGINRLSLGVQSTNPEELLLLGRIHSHAQTIRTIKLARDCGFNNINLDLIYGLPKQTMDTWKQTLSEILQLQPTHLSLYALKMEEGTPLERQVASRHLPLPDADLAADMYEFASEYLSANNFSQYEISNWALRTEDKAYQSRHNRQYWENLPYFGFGAGAHGLVNEQRLVNEPAIITYIHECTHTAPLHSPLGPATIEANQRTISEAMDEQVIMNLRLTEEGVSIPAFFSRFGVNLEERYRSEIDMVLKLGLVEYTANNQAIRLTPHGRLLGNQVFYRFLKD